MSWDQMLPMIDRYGVAIIMLVTFVYWDFRRRKKDEEDKKATIARLALIEDYQRDKMEKMVVENTTAQQNVADAAKDMSKTVRDVGQTQRQLTLAIKTRPCLRDAIDEIQRGKDA